MRELSFWWARGAYDAVAVVEFPDDETACAHAISLGMSGDFHSETMRAYPLEEMKRIIQKLP